MTNSSGALDSRLVSLFQCVECNHSSLDVRPDNGCHRIPGIPLDATQLHCSECDATYPITHDGIPILWTADLRRYLVSGARDDSPLHANIAVYDQISGQYDAHARIEPSNQQRVNAAASKLLGRLEFASQNDERTTTSADSAWHLDFGCGPGKVLEWLQPLGMQQIGLDVSLNNLRRARSNTGAWVVCGDAAKLPFRNHCFALVTESSVLHHIEDWRSALREVCRVCATDGGILLDSEPTEAHLAFGPIARALWTARHPVYRAFSRVLTSKVYHQSHDTAKISTRAEVHNQPGGGFSTTELEQLFADQGRQAEIIFSPTVTLSSKAQVTVKSSILKLLNLQNPWNPKNGPFVIMAHKAAAQKVA